jgi:hypothetical protein
VHHHRYAARVGDRQPPAQRLDAVVADRLPVDAHLDAVHQVAVLPDGVDRQWHVAVGQVTVFPGAPGQPDRRDVEQRGHPDRGAGRHPPQAGQRPGPGGPGVHPGGDAGVPGDRVRVDAPVARPDVRVQVDQARRDQPAGDVEHLVRVARQAPADRRDPAAGDRHVTRFAAGDQQVIGHGGPPAPG